MTRLLAGFFVQAQGRYRPKILAGQALASTGGYATLTFTAE